MYNTTWCEKCAHIVLITKAHRTNPAKDRNGVEVGAIMAGKLACGHQKSFVASLTNARWLVGDIA
jgi:hypothetical protein